MSIDGEKIEIVFTILAILTIVGMVFCVRGTILLEKAKKKILEERKKHFGPFPDTLVKGTIDSVFGNPPPGAIDVVNNKGENCTVATDSSYIQGKVQTLALLYRDEEATIDHWPFGDVPKDGIVTVVLRVSNFRKVTLNQDKISRYVVEKNENGNLDLNG